jgi:Fe-S cluster assembly protein SufD
LIEDVDVTTYAVERKVTGGAFTREAAEQLSRVKGEPEWLRARRLAAWDTADRLPMPAPYERAWKYFKPEQLRFEGLRLVSGGEQAAPADLKKGRGERFAGTLALRNGGAVREDLVEAARAQGVIFTSLDTAVREHPDLVQRHLGAVVPDDESPFVALGAAFWSGGAFVYVPRDVKVELPLHAMLTLTGAEMALFPRVLVVVDRGAEVVFLDELGGGDGPAFAGSVTELVLGDEARVQHYRLQRWGGGMQELLFQRADLGRNAHLITGFVGLGGRVQKGWIEARIRGTGARSDILGAVYGTGDQYFDVITLQDHIGDHTLSDLLIKSALKDRAQSAYYGLTRVGRYARMADANQEDRNLLLSDKAKAESDPVLEILTSEVVRCAHGASAGPVDQEQLFYLETRGLPRAEAERLLVQGFLGDVLRRVPNETVRDVLEGAVLEKLG